MGKSIYEYLNLDRESKNLQDSLFKTDQKEKGAIKTLETAFARWLACNYIANDPKYDKPENVPENLDMEKEVEKQANIYLSDPTFHQLFAPGRERAAVDMIAGPREEGEKPVPLPYVKATKSLATNIDVYKGVLNERDQEAERERLRMRKTAKEVVQKLDTTLQKSFTGKLKSWFVGNSKEYDAAYKALSGVADGSVQPEQAKQAVMTYLDLRGSKKRDHQYGRDRFDTMMKGLATLMTPKEFIQYCKQIDESRMKRDPKHAVKLQPYDYIPRSTLARDAAEKRRKAAEAELDRDIFLIKRDARDPDREAKDKSFLKRLETVDYKTLTPKEQMRMESYTKDHPALREAAQRINERRGLDLTIPGTAIDKLPADALKAMRKQEEVMNSPDREQRQVAKSAPQLKVNSIGGM